MRASSLLPLVGLLATAVPAAAQQPALLVQLTAETNDPAAADRAFARAVPGATSAPLFPFDDDVLHRLRRRAERRSGAELVDLRRFRRVVLPAGTDIGALRRLLEARDDTVLVQIEPAPAPPPGDILPVTPDFRGNQSYSGSGPLGIDALTAHARGLTGAGVHVADLEYSWNLAHEDLMAMPPNPLIGPAPVDPFNSDHHGTGAIGVVAADNDVYGITGIAHGATMNVVAAQTAAGRSVAVGVVRASLALQPGDVLLIEQQEFGPNGNDPNGNPYFVPVEYLAPTYWAIRQATALGIHVVEPAGNGFQDFDSTTPPLGHPTYATAFDRASRDSGAVMVGASQATGGHPRMVFTNFGRRVDAHSFGELVFTLGYGPCSNWGASAPAGCIDPFPLSPLDPNQFYTNVYNGTSSASAILAGAVALLEEAHRNAHGRPWKPWALRGVLRTAGIRTAGIGGQPDLAVLADAVATGPQPARLHSGTAPSVSGRAIVAVDLDGDGRDELVVGEPGSNQAVAYRGLDGSVMFTIQPITPSTTLGLGSSLAVTGDIDNDGVPDLAVGAPSTNTFGPRTGSVQLHSGTNGSSLTQLTGWAQATEFGAAVTGIGDLSGDGIPEVVVGAPGPGAQLNRAGDVHVFRGGTWSVMKTLTGQGGVGDRFGRALTSLGDVDGDGTPELVTAADALTAGRVEVWSPGSGWIVLRTLTGQNGEEVGRFVANPGDLDGDGRDEVMFGMPGWIDPVSGQRVGRVQAVDVTFGTIRRALTGTGTAGDRFGESGARVGDLDGDGVRDFLVGAPQTGSSPAGNGYARVLSGTNGALIEHLSGPPGATAFGATVLGLSDLDGDGAGEYAVGAPSYLRTGAFNEGGRVHVFASERPLGSPATLRVQNPFLSGTTGGGSLLRIDAGPTHAGKAYAVVGSLSGTVPGWTSPTGMVLPLNPDSFTTGVLSAGNVFPFNAFQGTLDGRGRATATLGPFPAGFLTPLTGLKVDWAAFTSDMLFFSNPVEVAVVP